MKTFPVSPLAPESFPDLPAIAGVEFATASLGLYGGRDELFVARFARPAAAAGVFTRSSTRSADVDFCRDALKLSGGRARALVVHAGNSNAFTGAAGIAKNEATVAAACALERCSPSQVYMSATGVIGVPLAPDRVASKLPEVWPKLGEAGLEQVARAFMTTDTYPKGSSASASIDGRSVSVAGVAKGSGMIAPNMATMLAYVFTDAAVSPRACQTLLSRFVDLTFNCVTVDGDTSTSDTLMLFATGAAGGDEIDDADDPRLAGFRKALLAVLKDLALQIVRDGEGATKLIEIACTGAETDAAARIIAASIANSPLVKTALAASDANWGRIIAAVGKTDEKVARDSISLWFGDVLVAKGGMKSPAYTEEDGAAECARQEIRIRVDVGVGSGKATVWTCDLTHAYIDINANYRT